MLTPSKLTETFLEYLLEQRLPVTIFLTNGVKLQGYVTCVAEDTLTLARDGITQLVFRHAVSTVMPGEPMQVYDLPGFGNK